MKNRVVILSILLQSAVLFGQAVPKLHLGVVLPMTGAQSTYGREAMRGVRLALADFVKENPQAKGHIRLFKIDDKSQTDRAKKGAEELYGTKRVHMVIGTISSAASMAMADVARKHQRPLIIPMSTTFGIENNPYAFSVSYDMPAQGVYLAKFATGKIAGRKAAIIRDDSKMAKDITDVFKKTFTSQNGVIVAEEVYPFGVDDFAAQITAVKNKMPDVVLVPGSSMASEEIMKQAKSLNLQARFLGSDNWDSPQLWREDSARGHFYSAHFSAQNPAPQVRAFVDAFKQAHGREPSTVAALAYDSVAVGLNAYWQAKSTLKRPLQRALERTSQFSGVTGSISFDETGVAQKSGFIKEISNGAAVLKSEIGL